MRGGLVGDFETCLRKKMGRNVAERDAHGFSEKKNTRGFEQ
jgi:hypothetical protein